MTTHLRPRIADYTHPDPLPDPPRETDMLQDQRIFDFRGALSLHFAHRDDVLIAGGGYLRRQRYDDGKRFAPDCVVAFGVNPAGIVVRNGYVINDVGKPPDFVLEVGSRSTGWRDYTVKRDGYADYGVKEYWRFDPSGGRFHDTALAGDVLAGEQYAPLPINREPDGLVWGYSPMLDLEICWDGGEVRFRDPYTKEFLTTPEEERLIREAETNRANAETNRADAETNRADAETNRANAERQARLDAEARADGERQARRAAEERIRLLESELGRGPGS